MSTNPADNTPAGNAPGTTETSPAGAQVSTPVASPASTGSADPTSFWKQFEKETATKPSEFFNRVNEVSEFVGQLKQEKAAQAQDEFVKTSVAKAMEGLPEGISERVVRGVLRDMIETDPKAKEAHDNYPTNPEGWFAVCKQANEELAKQIVRPSSGDGVRNEIDAAAAAVRNVSTQPIQKPALTPLQKFNMNERDWENYQREKWAAQT